MYVKGKFYFLLIIAFFIPFCIFSQQLESPSEGKVLVYFVRSGGAGALINFKYFDGEDYIGKFSGSNYMIYECDPGEHLLWASAENKDFIEADLEANKVYLILAKPQMGAMSAGVKIFPVAKDDEKKMKKISKILLKQEPKIMDPEDLDEDEVELEEFIQKWIAKYRKDKEKGLEFRILSSEMHHN